MYCIVLCCIVCVAHIIFLYIDFSPKCSLIKNVMYSMLALLMQEKKVDFLQDFDVNTPTSIVYMYMLCIYTYILMCRYRTIKQKCINTSKFVAHGIDNMPCHFFATVNPNAILKNFYIRVKYKFACIKKLLIIIMKYVAQN